MVCLEQRCEAQVFPLGVKLLDRYLAQGKVHKVHLQLLACVCLLTATKLRQCRALGVDLLVYYTDYSITAEEIRQWEQLLLVKLGWDVASITAYDFIDPLVEVIPSCRRSRRPRRNQETETPTSPVPDPVSPLRESSVDDETLSKIRDHAQTYVALCCTEYEFMQTAPSLLASACVTLAITDLKIERAANILDLMVQYTNGDRMRICSVLHRIKTLIAQQLAELDVLRQKSAHVGNAASKHQEVLDADGNPETPTDVQDVIF
ncbi:G1/S-specific cyclin-D2-like isoform X2 [Artemia franciscana]|uniref:Uncharacterized protein n=1 Tax=Artemia franciscana TaxID=6661 RepID=A0AA88HTX0_ARTSF|nr:hypothetical protein QYM36_006666 [Artemia franciscana]